MKRTFLTLLTSLALVACGGGGPNPNPPGGGAGGEDSFTFDVTWSPETTVMDEAQLSRCEGAKLARGPKQAAQLRKVKPGRTETPRTGARYGLTFPA